MRQIAKSTSRSRGLVTVVVALVATVLVGATATRANAQATKVAPPASVTKGTPTPAIAQGAAPKKPASAPVTVVDINRATAAQLEAVPGIGAAYAAKIIGGRPYTSKLQLVQKGLLPQSVYDKAKAHLIAKQ